MINDILKSSMFWGVILSLLSYGIGIQLKKRFKSGLFNPLLISIIITIVFLLVFRVDVELYQDSAKYLNYLLTPATVCLAIPLYEKMQALKENWKAILAGVISGVLTSMCVMLICSILFHFSHVEYITILPKSITTAIGIDLSIEYGGLEALTAIFIIVTGVTGNVVSDFVFKLFRITDPVAKGVALGTSSHAVGTSRAMEYGEIEGAMGSLSIVTAGLLTVVLTPLFAYMH